MSGETARQADEIPDAFARHVRSQFPADYVLPENEITGRWKYLTGPAERKFWTELVAERERQRLELLQARGEAAETAAELVRVKQLHAGLLGEVKPNGGGYTFRTTGVLLARRYAAANLPVRDDLSHLAGQ